MSGLCGWLGSSKGSAATDADAVSAMSAPLVRHDGSKAASAAFGAGAVTVAGADGEVSLFQNGHHLVAAWGRARFAEPELATIARQHGLARAISQGYARMGTAFLPLLSGHFALAILD